jgi:hypothetical protein
MRPLRFKITKSVLPEIYQNAYYQMKQKFSSSITFWMRILHSQQKKGKLYISLFIFIYPFGVMEVLTDLKAF